MRRRSWAWAAEQRPPRALKARRWPRRRPRSTAGSTEICGSFIATPVPEVRHAHLTGTIRFVNNKGVKWHETGKVETNVSHIPVQPHGRACPPDSMVRRGAADLRRRRWAVER